MATCECSACSRGITPREAASRSGGTSTFSRTLFIGFRGTPLSTIISSRAALLASMSASLPKSLVGFKSNLDDQSLVWTIRRTFCGDLLPSGIVRESPMRPVPNPAGPRKWNKAWRNSLSLSRSPSLSVFLEEVSRIAPLDHPGHSDYPGHHPRVLLRPNPRRPASAACAAEG